MSDDLRVELDGLQETQQNLVVLLEEVGAGGGLQAIIARATLRAHRYASTIVHVLTGRLKNSLFPRVFSKGNQAYGVIGTNVVYAPVEHARGGSHAFFQRTVDEDGQGIVGQVRDDVAQAARRADNR